VKRDASIKLVSEVRDLQIVDSEGRNCGICDDIEFHGAPGTPLTLAALLVGPGAYRRRLPRWAFRLVAMIAGERVARIPWKAVDKITARIFLSGPAEELGLLRTEDRLARAFRKIPTS
jgi:sporulation protein YlmC with PRC-barrel domain